MKTRHFWILVLSFFAGSIVNDVYGQSYLVQVFDYDSLGKKNVELAFGALVDYNETGISVISRRQRIPFTIEYESISQLKFNRKPIFYGLIGFSSTYVAGVVWVSSQNRSIVNNVGWVFGMPLIAAGGGLVAIFISPLFNKKIIINKRKRIDNEQRKLLNKFVASR